MQIIVCFCLSDSGCLRFLSQSDDVSDCGVGEEELFGEREIDVHDWSCAEHSVEFGNDESVSALLWCHSMLN